MSRIEGNTTPNETFKIVYVGPAMGMVVKHDKSISSGEECMDSMHTQRVPSSGERQKFQPWPTIIKQQQWSLK